MDTRFRLALAASISLLPLAPLTYRLAFLQIFQHRSLESKAAGEFTRSAEEIVPRGDILDRNGKLLAQSGQVWTCFADRRMVTHFEPLAARLAPLLKVSAAELVRRYKTGGRQPVLKRGLNFDDFQAVSAAKLEAVGLTAGQDRFYPNGELAKSLLGQVSMDGHGMAGLELILDKRLRGSARRVKVIRDGSGKAVHKTVEQEGPAPAAVTLTIDRNIQYFAEEALGDAAKQFAMKQGIAAVQDPNTGEILAMAVYPPNALKNPLVQDTYEPGSTFKTITAAAALEDNVVHEEDTFTCENGSWEVAPGTVIHDHDPQGELTLSGILEHSSNICAAKIGLRLGAARFYRYARAFGFASRTGIALPGETAGELRPLSEMTRVALAASAYGYGVAVSPLQVLGAYSAVANGGTLYEPTLIRDGHSPVRVRRVASGHTMERLSHMLEGVVERAAISAKISGYRIAGKTGTARKLDAATKRYSQTQYNASFAGFLPASKPRWTILVVIEDPKGQYYGAQVAAPVFAKIGKQLLFLNGVPPDNPATIAAH